MDQIMQACHLKSHNTFTRLCLNDLTRQDQTEGLYHLGAFIAAQQVMPPSEQIPGTKQGGHDTGNHMDKVCQNPRESWRKPLSLLWAPNVCQATSSSSSTLVSECSSMMVAVFARIFFSSVSVSLPSDPECWDSAYCYNRQDYCSVIESEILF